VKVFAWCIFCAGLAGAREEIKMANRKTVVIDWTEDLKEEARQDAAVAAPLNIRRREASDDAAAPLDIRRREDIPLTIRRRPPGSQPR
jgi:hypothetical protein